MLIFKSLCTFLLVGFFFTIPLSLQGSTGRETAKTDIASDIVERINSDELFLKQEDLKTEHSEVVRTLIMLRKAKLALISGKRAEFDDLLTKIVINATSSPDSFVEFHYQFASTLSLAIELGWSISNQGVLDLYKTATTAIAEPLSTIHNRITYDFATRNLENLTSSMSLLPPITEVSNSWEVFLFALADLRYYMLSGEVSKLNEAIVLFQRVSNAPSEADSFGSVDRTRLFDARIRLQLANAFLMLHEISGPEMKRVNLEHGFKAWNELAYPSLIVDHPALWGAYMHLYSQILDSTLSMYNEVSVEAPVSQIRELRHRRDEAYLLASRYR